MGTTMVRAGLRARPYRENDATAVLRLISDQVIPGLPLVTPEQLDLALDCFCPADPKLEAVLSNVCIDVLTSGDDELVVGIVCYARRTTDADGMLLWLYCQDDDQLLAAVLIEHALAELGRRTVHAFTEPSALAPAGLPARYRRGTQRALEATGFSSTGQWICLYHRLDGPPSHLHTVAEFVETIDPPGWHLQLSESDGASIGEAAVTASGAGVANLDWISLEPGQRRLGHIFLETCLVNLAGRGIRHVTTSLPSPAEDQPDRSSALLQLLSEVGFQEVDHLHAFARRP